MKSILKRTLSLGKQQQQQQQQQQEQPQIRITDATPTEEHIFQIEELFDKRMEAEVENVLMSYNIF